MLIRFFSSEKRGGKSSALQLSCSSRFRHSQLSACIHYQLVSQLYVPECSKQFFSQLFELVIKRQTFMWQCKSWVSAMQFFSTNKSHTNTCIEFLTEGRFWVKVSIRPVSLQVLMSGVPSFSFCELCGVFFLWSSCMDAECKGKM